MPVRISPKSPIFISETTESDLLTDVLRRLRFRAGIFRQGTYCGTWALDSSGATDTIFHLIGRGQAWVHCEGKREPIAVRGGDLVMFPHGDRHQISGTPQRRSGTRLTAADGGPFTTVLCATVKFEASGANLVMKALPPVIVVRSEDQDTSAELHALARLMLVEYEAVAAGRQGVLDRLAEGKRPVSTVLTKRWESSSETYDGLHGGDIPGQQLLDAIDRMLRDTL
jgi:hypothetical protein